LTAVIAGALLMIQFEAVTVLGVTLPAGVFADLNAAGLPLGPLGLAGGAAVGAWVEWALLRRRLGAAIGALGGGAGPYARMLAAAAIGALAGRIVAALVPLTPLPVALLAAGVFGLVYLGVAHVLRLGEARTLCSAALSRLRRR
jgi:hypothetical protein